VSTFLRIVVLHRQGTALKEIAFVTQSSARRVADYLAVYEAALKVDHRAAKLAEEIARVSGAPPEAAAPAEKRGVTS
jgi:hypothetical protein